MLEEVPNPKLLLNDIRGSGLNPNNNNLNSESFFLNKIISKLLKVL